MSDSVHVCMFVTCMHEHTIWLEMLWCWEYSQFAFRLSTNAVLLYSRQKTVQYRNTAFCMQNLSLPGMLSHNQNISGMDVVVWCCDYVYILNCSIIVYLHYSTMYNSRGWISQNRTNSVFQKTLRGIFFSTKTLRKDLNQGQGGGFYDRY